MFLFLLYIPLFISPGLLCNLLSSVSFIAVALICKVGAFLPQSFQRAEISHSISSYSRKPVYILDANLLWEEQQSLCASCCGGGDAGAAGHHPGILVPTVYCQARCTDSGQRSRCWNHWLGDSSLRRWDGFKGKRCQPCVIFASVFIHMWKALPFHLSCTPTPRPPFQMSFQLLFLILASRQMFHCSRITVKFLPGLPHIMGQFPREPHNPTTSEMAKGRSKRQI